MFLKVILWKIKQTYGNWRTQYKYYQDAIQDELQSKKREEVQGVFQDLITPRVKLANKQLYENLNHKDLHFLSDKEVESEATYPLHYHKKHKKTIEKALKEIKKAQPKKARKGTR